MWHFIYAALLRLHNYCPVCVCNIWQSSKLHFQMYVVWKWKCLLFFLKDLVHFTAAQYTEHCRMAMTQNKHPSLKNRCLNWRKKYQCPDWAAIISMPLLIRACSKPRQQFSRWQPTDSFFIYLYKNRLLAILHSFVFSPFIFCYSIWRVSKQLKELAHTLEHMQRKQAIFHTSTNEGIHPDIKKCACQLAAEWIS